MSPYPDAIGHRPGLADRSAGKTDVRQFFSSFETNTGSIS
jgi:hypothetical protein